MDEPFCEAWERFKSLLRKCPNHGFEDIAQLNFFVNGIKPEVKMLLDAAAGGTMMSVGPEEATQIIESLASSDHQAEHGRHQSHKRGIMDLSTNDAILAQNKLLSQQIEALTKQMAKIPQQLHAINSPPIQPNPPLRSSIKNLEVQVGQLAKQLADMSGGPFSANTETNPKEYCQAITTRMEKEKNKKKGKEVISTVPIKDLPYPHAPSKKEKERQFARFLDIIKKLQINIPFTEAMEQMPTYARFMKEMLTKKRKILEEETIELEAGCSAIIQKSLPQKSRDPGSFTLPVSIGNLSVSKALLDLGASINLMPLFMLKKIGEVEVRPTRMTLQLANRSIKLPHGIVEDMIVKVDKFMFPVDFVVMDMEEDTEVPLILGRPFMKTARVIIDMNDGNLKVRVQDKEVSFNVFEEMKFPKVNKDCFRIDVLDDLYLETQNDFKSSSPLEKALLISNEELDKFIELEAGCSAIIQKSLPQKSRDPGSFTLPVSIGNLSVSKALLDLGASINLMPLFMLKKIGEVEVRPTRMTLQLANRSIKLPHGIVEDMIVKVDKFMFPVDFVVMDMEEDTEVPLILGRPFMKTARVIIDMNDGNLKVRVQDKEVSFNVFEEMKFTKVKKD
uniref:Retrotransposon gag domain-containing protein n=1 Tax=Cajanus cajan TaxID=3821 RepID=A0A151QPB5_CAJCA|nr:hypothetical protein KK1_047295 [Cajanus cajan]